MDAFEPMIRSAKNNIKKFIYASSSSIYGVSDKPNVTEDVISTLTLYNKYKGMCEPILFKYTDNAFMELYLDQLLFVDTRPMRLNMIIS